MKIKFIEKENLSIILPFLGLLNENTDKEILELRLEEMKNNSYYCVGVFDNEKLIGICGFWLLVKYYVGKHIEPDNVVILPEYRNQNIGNKMMEFVYEYAKNNGCIASELNCYVANNSGIKFWLNQGYKILGFHFQKKL
ncbi:MAG: GNAT family N-acetyltransferase [Flavobacteriales bacterium]|jgi:GNAT superfamily N-acetyltransferase|nr:GNAT family N-acetyltransferase [Flavobacteriales bacterium]